ncbi:MAG TPA: PSD1 and planctomycete cytochrome C domain-containing protein, partial [Opitutaceae bacterium]|nr:PSD1 and planctomycete cytochrome C domain-containing protein [Opitutaceae bacterium]
MSSLRVLLRTIPLVLLPPASAQVANADFFRQHVEPILRDNCYKCHSHSADKIKGGLLLDSRSAALTGGDSGAALVPGHPEKSLLIEAIGYVNEDLQMPPKGKKLSVEQIATLTEWIRQGAVWPEDSNAPLKARRKGGISPEDRQWWAFQPVAKVGPPATRDAWPVNDIDRFILARLKAEGLQPAPRAQKQALLRRVYFDVTGLPPTPHDVDAFLADTSPDAYAKVIDRLLASPRYGERWATHWLDLVRYAESDGYRADDYRPNAWRYRDYVIDAFNSDKPYDRFVQEQLAGDELWPGDPAAQTATGYLTHWIYEWNQRDAVDQRQTILNDITDTTADAFLALGLQCARCHDHKFDPILQKDYFRLQAFFAALKHAEDVPVATPAQRAAYEKQLAIWEEKTADLRRQLAELDRPYRQKVQDDAVGKFPPETRAYYSKPATERTPFEQQIVRLIFKQVEYDWDEKRFAAIVKEPAKSKRNALMAALKKFEADRPEPLPASLVATDIGREAPPVRIAKKPALGDIAPGFLTLLQEGPAGIDPVSTPTTGRRAALARWLTSAENPLTARVIANRVWQSHFGRGLAVNASDFGRLGEKPSHPELLDWLARSLIENRWSLKQLHRLILTSATYTQASTSPIAAQATLKDPENRLLWRGSIRRLEAEQIRDAALATTGELKLRSGGPSAETAEPVRSIYQKVRRNRPDPTLEVFDQPERIVSSAERNVTTTSTQSLFMFNSRWSQERAAAFAARLRRDRPSDVASALTSAYRLAFGRDPTAAERDSARVFLAQQAARIAAQAPEEDVLPF